MVQDLMERHYRTESQGMFGGWEDIAIDLSDGYQVLQFAYGYLARRGLPPSDAEVLRVTTAVAKFRFGPLVSADKLVSFIWHCAHDDAHPHGAR